MKIFNLIKSIPFLLTLIILIFLSINNQKQYIKLKILIWNTPSLSLGTYLAISTGTGYLLSYIVTSNMAKFNKSNEGNKIKYKLDSQHEVNSPYQESYNRIAYDNTLIERDIKDPSPTINANFRVIGKTAKNNQAIENFEKDDYFNTDLTDKSEYQYYQENDNYKKDIVTNTIYNDWEDDTYSNW